MPKGYWIMHIDVHNTEDYPNYMQKAGAAIGKFGGRFVVRGGEHEKVEGQSRSRHVVVEFDSYERALECYRSPEYQDALKLRQAYANSDGIIISGPED